MNFLRYDSPFMVKFRQIVDYFLLGLLWVAASFPIVTFGAATTAMFLTAENVVHAKEERMFSRFWGYFKAEFKQATITWLIEMVVLALLFLDFVLVSELEMFFLLEALSYLLIALVFIWVQLWLGYQSKFEDNIKTVLINTFRISFASLGSVALLAVVDVLGVVLAYAMLIVMPPLMLVVPGVYIIAYLPLMRKLFKKYIPQEMGEKMTILAED